MCGEKEEEVAQMQKMAREKTVTAVEVTTALPQAKHVAAEEERVLRMRYGARTSTAEPLARHGEGNPDLASELLLIEMQLLQQSRARMRMAQAKVVPISSRTKDKIIRALRRR